MKTKTKSIMHIGFEIGLALKGFIALAEILSGIALIFLNPDRMNIIIDFISKNELYEDPRDLLMNFIVTYGHGFSVSAQQFAIFYLLSHGIVKLAVILLLWRGKIWAYPLSIIMFLGFIMYQMSHYMSTHSIMLLILTVLDVVMIGLTALEYQRVKNTKRMA